MLVVGAIAATLSALPAAYLGYVTASSWTGCFGQCGEPDRGPAMKAAFIALVVVSGPVALMAVLMPRGQRLRWVPVFAVLVLAVMSLVTLVWVRVGVS